MEGNKEKAEFLQRALGYSLLGINKEECMFIAYGQTRSGKGTLFNSIAKVLNSGSDNGYGGTVNSSLLLSNRFKEKDYNAPEPMLADTVSVRYLTLSETKQNAVLDVNAIKSLTGRDPRKTRQLHSTAFTFTPQFTMWLSTNFLPKVNDDSIFKSDRVWVIEFNKHFDESNRDTDLKLLFDKKENRAIILQWLVEGYSKYVKDGLNPPECVREATAKYARENDRILCFKEECLEDVPESTVSNAAMYACYKNWCSHDERDFTPLGTTSFYKQLARFYHRKDSNGFRGFVDVKIKM
jgi:putative DNA primase/helicase